MKKLTTPWTELIAVNDVWFYVLEFIPADKLIRTFSVLDKYHHEVIHSPHTYAHLLIRDFIEYDIVPKYMVKKILAQYDYKRFLSKLVNTKVKVMKLSKNFRSEEVNLSSQELNCLKKSFQNMFTHLRGIMTRIVEYRLTEEEHRLFFLGERLDRIMLPKVLLEEEEEDEDDYFEDHYEVVEPIDCPKHAVTQIDKHAFAQRIIYVDYTKRMLFFCNCGVAYVINDNPKQYFDAPELKKDGMQKILYDVSDEECGFTFVKRGIWKQSDYDIRDWIIPFEYKKSKEE